MQYVPVVDSNQRPLMPTTPNRAERWSKSGKATPFFRKGIFCVRLNVEPSGRVTQSVAVGRIQRLGGYYNKRKSAPIETL
ncbi:RRXRR domain-containing protein [Prochlorothrix hollandica]|uniref:RRXRR domain-containing protein n=1 Tax=Prochlorothrix hollandica TaxID=1223 RepID=UPI0009D9D8ED